jgi:hypothetical protein
MKLETAEFIMAIEAAFVIEIPDSEAELVVSLGQLQETVSVQLGRLNRPLDPGRVLNQITYIAALVGGLERKRLRAETTLTEVLAGITNGWDHPAATANVGERPRTDKWNIFQALCGILWS